MRCETRALCEELINIGERSHVYVPSKEAVDSSLGTKGRGFVTGVLICVAVCASVLDCCQGNSLQVFRFSIEVGNNVLLVHC